MLVPVLAALATLASAAPAPLEARQETDVAYHIQETVQNRAYFAAMKSYNPDTGLLSEPAKNGERISWTIYWNDRYVSNFWSIDDLTGGPTAISSWGGLKCIDAGLSPRNGTPLKVWDCYYGSPQQTWQIIDGKKIRLINTNLCIDLTDGSAAKSPQLWECFPNNPNQVWKFPKTVYY